mmetsp:Transcript_15035/g.40320  ORF Transcript_15035/g.40320 Transcript_15035/m.40320 type:complete len:262 (-) Transcript_15035:809-1594(-)
MMTFQVRGVSLRLFERAESDVTDEPLSIAPLFEIEWTGSVVWSAAYALAEVLAARQGEIPRLVIDLGSGTGVAGLFAACLAPSSSTAVLLTDRDELLPILERNARENGGKIGGALIKVAPLVWDEASAVEQARSFIKFARERDADSDLGLLVLASDCLNGIYGESHALMLARTINKLLVSSNLALGNSRTALVSQTRRGDKAERMFLDVCADLGLVVKNIDWNASSDADDVTPFDSKSINDCTIDVWEISAAHTLHWPRVR